MTGSAKQTIKRQERKSGLLRRIRLRSLSYGGQVAPRKDGKPHPDSFVVPAKAGTHSRALSFWTRRPRPSVQRTPVAMGPCFRRDDARGFDCQTTDTTSRSRGAMRPSRAFISRPKEGVGNAGCPLHPQPRVQCVGSTRVSSPRSHRNTRHSRTQWF